MQYPIRAKIVNHKNDTHIGKEGLAEKIDDRVKITLDDGNTIYGDECWWIMLE